MSDDELARAWARCMRHLRNRDLIRTANTPVGDYAERIHAGEPEPAARRDPRH